MNQDQLAELKALVGRIERIPKQNTVIIGPFMALLAGWNIWCQSRPWATRDEIEAVYALVKKQDATILELRRIIAMQREDPKAFPRLTEQFKAIENHEHARANRNRRDQRD